MTGKNVAITVSSKETEELLLTINGELVSVEGNRVTFLNVNGEENWIEVDPEIHDLDIEPQS